MKKSYPMKTIRLSLINEHDKLCIHKLAMTFSCAGRQSVEKHNSDTWGQYNFGEKKVQAWSCLTIILIKRK